MKKLAIILPICLALGSSCKNDEAVPLRYVDALYSVGSDDNLTYSDVDATNQTMVVYYPTNDNNEKRPLLVFAGDGHWLPSNLDILQSMATRFAQAGYVVALIRYFSDPDATTIVSHELRTITAVQDFKAAIRYFRKDAEGNNVYKIDPNNIFIGGDGTGGYVALYEAYISPDDLDQEMLNLIEANGGLDGTRGNAGFSTTANAIFSMSGEVADLGWIDGGEMPVICVQSTGDPLVPYEVGTSLSGGTAYGSAKITERASQVGIANELVPVNSVEHNAPLGCDDCFTKVLQFFSPYIK